MKKFVLFVFCLISLTAVPAYGTIVFNENFETGSSPFSFVWEWTKGDAYNTGSLVTEDGNRFWREIFRPGSTDTYFGFSTELTNATAITNTLFFRFKVRYGDASHPYTWDTADRSHELKFPDLCPGMAGNGDRARIICKHRRGSDNNHGIFRVYTPIDAYNHDLPTQLVSNRWYTIQFMIQDNGTNGDVVKIWLDNDNQNSPNYSYTASGKDMFDASGNRWRNFVEWAYRNHAVPSDRYFYFDDITISTTFITGSGGGTNPPPACSYSINPASSSLDSAAHTGSFSVSSSTGCSWTATANANWITITSGSSGSGNGSVAYSVTANSGSSQRSGTITAAGRTYTITQAAASTPPPACTYGLSPTSANFDSAAHTGSFSISAQSSSCQWTARSNSSWITITSGSSGSGAGTVNYSLAGNTSSSQRTGTITAAGMTFTVRQAAAVTPPPTACTYGISNDVVYNGDVHTGTVSVSTSSSNCTWTAVSNTSWITITAGSSGTGPGTVYYSIEKNSRIFHRTGTLTIAGKTYTIRQASIYSSWLPNASLQPPRRLRVH